VILVSIRPLSSLVASALVLVAPALLVVSACSSDDPASPAAPTSDAAPPGEDAATSVEDAATGPVTVTAVAGSDQSTCALLSNGAVRCWGKNDSGQAGTGSLSDVIRKPGPPVDLGAGKTATSICLGSGHTCALLAGGSIKCWGYNDSGLLGTGDTTPHGGTPGSMGDNLPAVDLGPGRTAVSVSCGASHTCAILDEGTLKCWGLNSDGELGLGDALLRGYVASGMGSGLPPVALGTGKKAVQVAAGASFTCARLDDGTVKCWGNNNYGQLGRGDTTKVGDKPAQMGDALAAINLGAGRTARQVYASYTGACAQLDDGTTKCWGAAPSGSSETATWHGDEAGEVGDALKPLDFGTGRKPLEIALGGSMLCVRLDDKSVRCLGANSLGQLGAEDFVDRSDPSLQGNLLPVVNLGTGRTATALGAGGAHVCAVLDDGTLKCWGLNHAGQLGVGDTGNRGSFKGDMGDGLPAVLP
jgi:E3 ubiquitin-protein ligase HERC3